MKRSFTFFSPSIPRGWNGLRAKGSNGEGKVEGVKIQQGYVGGFFEEDLAFSALNLETHAPTDLGNFHVPGPEQYSKEPPLPAKGKVRTL